MEKKPRITISDLSNGRKVSNEEMKKIKGGWVVYFGIWEIGSIPGSSELDSDFSYYVKNNVDDDTTFY